jgi:hypothetical protein
LSLVEFFNCHPGEDSSDKQDSFRIQLFLIVFLLIDFSNQSLYYKTKYRAEGDISTRHARRQIAGSSKFKGFLLLIPFFILIMDWHESGIYKIVIRSPPGPEKTADGLQPEGGAPGAAKSLAGCITR